MEPVGYSVSARRSRALAAAAGLLLALPLLAAAAEPLRVGVTAFPPGVVADENGRASGPAIDILLDILGEAGYQAEVRVYPSVRVRALVENGDLDMSIATRVWDKDHIALFPDTPFGEQTIGLFWRDPFHDVYSLRQLDGRTVIVPLGQFTPAALLKREAPLAILREARDFGGAIAMLQNGRADYLLDWEKPVQSQLDILGLTLHHLSLPPVHTYVVVARRRPDAEEISRHIDAVMKRLTAEGKLPLR